MEHYNIIPAARTSRGRSESFTYSSDVTLSPGDIVRIPLGRQTPLGLVIEKTTAKTSFAVKPILEVVVPRYLDAVHQKLLFWMSQYYHISPGLLLPLFLTGFPKKIRTLASQEESAAVPSVPPTLTQEQASALTKILSHVINETFGAFLLLGITGSGKTEIYVQVASQLIQQKKQVLILVPEIALTPQIVERFSERYPQVVSYHSKLTTKQKEEIASRIFSGDPLTIIGPRSALFLPFRHLGAIILDEEHDQSFQQFDKTPRYDARTVALEFARLQKIPIVYGDATPRIETFHQTKTGELTLLPLTQRISSENDDIALPTIEVVDIVGELKNRNKSALSLKLQEEVRAALKNHEQVFLFLNRRGYASSILCFACRNVIACKNCSTPLVLHGRTLICHQCGFHMPLPLACPTCEKRALRAQGLGTERVEHEVKQLFPGARVLRIDSDTMKHRSHYQELYDKLMAHEVDIIIGTQMIAQGFDIPQVALVGVIQVDSILNLPDFHAEERAFQILTQVAGRAGRRNKQGRVIIQTFFPEHWVFSAVASHRFDQFYEKEIVSREKFQNPPFTHFVQLTFHHKSNIAAEKEAQKLFLVLEKTGVNVLGPSPSFIPKKRGEYYWQILLSATKIADFPFDKIPETWDSTIDPQSLLS